MPDPLQDTLQERIRQESTRLQAICHALGREIARLGLDDAPPDSAALTCQLQQDPASGALTLAGAWRNARGHLLGQVLLHGDGSFFAEYDVIRPHPTKPRWFVEAVTAWGRGDEIRSEPRLLPVVE